MNMALVIKNKQGFINGTIQKPSNSSTTELQQWTRCNNLVKSWLLNSISQDISASVIYNEVAHEIWADLKERFSHVNSVHLFHIEQTIHECNQDSMTIGAYYTKLKGLWDERDALCSIPACTCGTMKEVLHLLQSQKTMKFLMGLNETYAAVRGQILLMDPLPTVNKVHSFVLQDEKQRVAPINAAPMPDAAAFAIRDNSRTPGRIYSPRNPHLKCEICDKVGHTSETCRAHLKCDYCGWSGHTIDVCRKLQRTKSTGSKPNLQDQRFFAPKANHVNTQTASPSFTLTAAQYEKFMALLGNNNPTSVANNVGNVSTTSDRSGKTFCASVLGNNIWILDTGATDHMICTYGLRGSVKK